MAPVILPGPFDEAARRGERDRFDHLVHELRGRAPDAYAEEQAYILDWQISDALAAGREAELHDLGIQFAEIASEHLDLFGLSADQLAFHGRQDLLLEMTRLAWPRVSGKEAPERLQWAANLTDLSGEFLHHLRCDHSIPYSRGELGREALVDYIQERADGDLEPSGDGGGPRRRRGKGAAPDARAAGDALCPDGRSVDQFFQALLDLFLPRYVAAAAFVEAIPLWLSFLESRGLIGATQRERSLADVARAADTLHQILAKDRPDDPALAEAVARWPRGEA